MRMNDSCECGARHRMRSVLHKGQSFLSFNPGEGVWARRVRSVSSRGGGAGVSDTGVGLLRQISTNNFLMTTWPSG